MSYRVLSDLAWAMAYFGEPLGKQRRFAEPGRSRDQRERMLPSLLKTLDEVNTMDQLLTRGWNMQLSRH